MIPDYLITIFKLILVGIILLGMIVILLGINHLSHNDGSLSASETDLYKEDIKTEKKVISSRSVFNNFLGRNMRKEIRR